MESLFRAKSEKLKRRFSVSASMKILKAAKAIKSREIMHLVRRQPGEWKSHFVGIGSLQRRDSFTTWSWIIFQEILVFQPRLLELKYCDASEPVVCELSKMIYLYQAFVFFLSYRCLNKALFRAISLLRLDCWQSIFQFPVIGRYILRCKSRL